MELTEVIELDNLISISSFLREIRMERREFMRFRQSNRIEGVISIAGRNVVDRSRINIKFMRGGDRFRRWIELGGRTKPVVVE